MRNGQLVLVACKIQRGAFSGERVFQLPMVEGGDYSGIAPVGHCFDDNRNPLPKDRPTPGSEIDGFVEAYLISNGGTDARIELPDGEVIQIPASQVRYQKELDRESKYVPV